MDEAELLRQRIATCRRFLKESLLERGFKHFYAELLESDQAALNQIEIKEESKKKKNGRRKSGWMWTKRE